LEIRLKPSISGVIVITGEVVGERVIGLSIEALSRLYKFCKSNGFPLFIEADGSRKLPIKAPADHEPLIPFFIDTVVVTAGLSALNKALDSNCVYQPERFSHLSCTPIGDPIDPGSICRVLLNHQGGLKNIPENSKRIVLLNQCDYEWLRESALKMVHQLLSGYDSVLISTRNSRLEQGNSKVVTEFQSAGVQKLCVQSVHEPTAGVILAAGQAQRMGRAKQLLPWQGKALVWHAASAALMAELDPVIVVSGAFHYGVKSAVGDLPVKVIQNKNWQDGQGTSVSCGVNAIPEDIGSVIFFLADQPRISVLLIRKLIEEHSKSLSPILTPWFEGRMGNPVLFDISLKEPLLSLSGEEGGRSLFPHYKIKRVPWADSSAFIDVDTVEDYEDLLNFVHNGNNQ
jgi:molybdenum cofactor cytidylyltransferase